MASSKRSACCSRVFSSISCDFSRSGSLAQRLGLFSAVRYPSVGYRVRIRGVDSPHANSNGRTLRVVDERRFKDVLFFVLAIGLLAAIYWVIYYAWK
jgi:hypothetical protein